MQRLHVGILIFDDVELLDLAGPFEVFSRARLVLGVESRRSDESAPALLARGDHSLCGIVSFPARLTLQKSTLRGRRQETAAAGTYQPMAWAPWRGSALPRQEPQPRPAKSENGRYVIYAPQTGCLAPGCGAAW